MLLQLEAETVKGEFRVYESPDLYGYVMLAWAMIDRAAADVRKPPKDADEFMDPREWLLSEGWDYLELLGCNIDPDTWLDWIDAGCPDRFLDNLKAGKVQAESNQNYDLF